MNIYEKIGRLIKQNKIFNLSENCNSNSKSPIPTPQSPIPNPQSPI